MNWSFWRFSCVCLLIALMGCVASVLAFDIAVYFDARSAPNWRMQTVDSIFCWDEASRATVLGNLSAAEQPVLDSIAELGTNYLVTFYPFGTDLSALHDRQLHGMRILNWSYPNEAFKYLEAQYRNLYVAYQDSAYTDPANWTNRTARRVFDDNLDRWVLQCDSNLADTMYRPQTNLGAWTGWARREAWLSGNVYMPMHFKILCNLIPTTPAPPDSQVIAKFFWLVKNTEGEGWWRYPAHNFYTCDFSEPNRLDTVTFTIDPSPEGGGTFTQLDDYFQPGSPSRTSDNHAFGTGSLDDNLPYHAYDSWDVPVRMCFYYQGNNQTFQVYEVNVWDEGYHRLFVSSDTTTFFPELRNAFQSQSNFVGDSLFAGWYFDEWIQTEQLKSFVKVNKIIENVVTNSMYINGQPGWDGCNGCFRNELFNQMNEQAVSLNVHMDEFYLFGGARAPSPIIRYMYTDPNSDADYFHLEATYADSTILATQSLQCAIDERVFGDSAIIHDRQLPIPSYWEHEHLSLRDQILYVHEDPARKFWAMIQGDDDNLLDSAECCWKVRRPSPNEVKLGAWLAVACDADGILWYPVQVGGGLLEWNPIEADSCDKSSNWAHTSASPQTTDRYDAAKEACDDIRYIAPTLDPLRFVKTYASRAYERNYPDSLLDLGDPAIQPDTLAYVPWNTHGYRIVDSIFAWEPDSFNMDSTAVLTWAENPEPHPYVQISRFQNPYVGATDEDYWFLIVNRRALAHEFRKVRLSIQTDTVRLCDPRWLSYVLGDSLKLSQTPDRDVCDDRRWLDVILRPGEAELVHFYTGNLGCDSAVAQIQELTATHYDGHAVRLNWEEITHTDGCDTCPVSVDAYYVCVSPTYDGPFTPIAATTATSYVDSAFSWYPMHFYQVQACGSAIERENSLKRRNLLVTSKRSAAKN